MQVAGCSWVGSELISELTSGSWENDFGTRSQCLAGSDHAGKEERVDSIRKTRNWKRGKKTTVVVKQEIHQLTMKSPIRSELENYSRRKKMSEVTNQALIKATSSWPQLIRKQKNQGIDKYRCVPAVRKQKRRKESSSSRWEGVGEEATRAFHSVSGGCA